ncbi:helix-turn-helix transcriptional regulator [Ornithinibacter aureus]|nr:helix-turn-helix domain-containing protein [Ornithinibacter aureus]
MGPSPSRVLGDAGEPTPPPLDPSRLRVLRELAGADRACTVGELAQALGGHPNTTRHHLRALLAAGLVQVPDTADAGGRGRPATRYVVTPQGRRTASGVVEGDPAAEEYLALAGAFADRLAALGVDTSEESRAVGRAWGASLAARDVAAAGGGPAGPARERVVELLHRLGFSPVVRPTPDRDIGREGGRDIGREVELRTCPLLDAARRHPEVVCQVHAGLVSGADAGYGGSGEGVRLVPFASPGACHLTLASAR